MATRKRKRSVSPSRAPARRAPTPRGVGGNATKKKTSRKPTKKHTLVEPNDTIEQITTLIKAVPDFPSKGVVFRDITPLLGDAVGFQTVINKMVEMIMPHRVDYIVAIESRGFIFGAALASRLGAGLVLVRKEGKLPRAAHGVDYSLEYGHARLEIHRDALPRRARVAIIDDVLATGGTAHAAAQLVAKTGAKVACFGFPIELDFLQGRKQLSAPVLSLVHY